MKPRTCNILISICNDKGEHACYSLRPLPPDELGEGVAGFYLTKLNCDPVRPFMPSSPRRMVPSLATARNTASVPVVNTPRR